LKGLARDWYRFVDLSEFGKTLGQMQAIINKSICIWGRLDRNLVKPRRIFPPTRGTASLSDFPGFPRIDMIHVNFIEQFVRAQGHQIGKLLVANFALGPSHQ
jgi:hypothetical protein